MAQEISGSILTISNRPRCKRKQIITSAGEIIREIRCSRKLEIENGKVATISYTFLVAGSDFEQHRRIMAGKEVSILGN